MTDNELNGNDVLNIADDAQNEFAPESAAPPTVEEIPATETEQAVPGEESAESSEEAAETAEEEVPGAMEEEVPETVEEETSETVEEEPKDPSLYHNRYYLLYGDDHEPEHFDTKGTIGFLESIGITGGELGQARRGKDLSAIYEILAGDDEAENHCSYCGCPIRGADYYRLPDGRARCTVCTRTQVKTTEELKELFERVKDNLMVYFGADITVPVRVEMLDEKKLKRKLKNPLINVDDNSMLVLGVAVKKGKNYTIYLENGAPRITVIATIAHEMTHIWQYTHWNEKEILAKYGAKNRLTVYEGMAMWTEIQYLYLIGEVGTAKRDEQVTIQRKDEYGVGFNAYATVYPIDRAGVSSSDTPFTAGNNPLQF